MAYGLKIEWLKTLEDSVHDRSSPSHQRDDSSHIPTHDVATCCYTHNKNRFVLSMIFHSAVVYPFSGCIEMNSFIHCNMTIAPIWDEKGRVNSFHSSRAHHIVGMSNDKVHSPEATSDYEESYDSAESDFLSIVPEDQRVSGD